MAAAVAGGGPTAECPVPEQTSQAAATGTATASTVGSGTKDREQSPRRRLSLGVCCMESKATSKPMQAILRRLELCGDFVIVTFPEDVILQQDPADWPIVDCLIAFSSTGFPLEKCIDYVKLRKPLCVNNVEAQVIFRSRVAVYRTMREYCIPCPDHIVVEHQAIAPDSDELVENENFIIYRGKKISKPFVEKPEDGDRHDIWIYYPRSIGGGAKKLFRKVKDQSSEFDPNQNTIRRDGTYIYEPFLPTQGTDIKVYTVGSDYVHAEARKAPTVDGKVQRSKDGKEIRYPVVLTQREKVVAAIIVKAFQQNICGFDILRTEGGSYVCDVNGWSFVKGNQKYYNDCSTLIRKNLLERCGVSGVDTSTMMILGPGEEQVSNTGLDVSAHDYSMRESMVNRSPARERLRSVIVIMRHGDRRPKEKMKFKTKLAPVLSYFDNVEADTAEVKLKTPEEMSVLKQRFDECATQLRQKLRELEGETAADGDEETAKLDEKRSSIKEELLNIELLIPVLEMKDRFSGLERKVQLKAVKWKAQKEDEPKSARKAAQVLVVAKWGGELTVSGLERATELGRQLRHDLYPNDPAGLLRLHSSFRHDFKIYSSQEGRCQITAAAFTKGFLDLDGDIIPILVSLVTKDSYAQGLLDEPIPKKQRDAVKQKIESLLLSYDDMSSEEVMRSACPTDHVGLREAARRIRSPLQLLHTIRYLALEYIESIAAAKDETYEEMKRHSHTDDAAHDEHDDCQDDAVPLGNQVPQGPGLQIPEDLKESNKRKWLHLRRKEHRWRKLLSGFIRVKDEEKGLSQDENVTYDASKIPDVWDNLYYDMLTHRHYLGENSCRIAEMMVGLIHPLNEWVCLSEYGISAEEKLRIGVDVTWRLLGKLLNDLEFMIEDDVGTIDQAGQHKDVGGVPTTGVARNMSGVPAAPPGLRRFTSVPGAFLAPPAPPFAPEPRAGAQPAPAAPPPSEPAPSEGAPVGPAAAPERAPSPSGVQEPAMVSAESSRAWKEWATSNSAMESSAPDSEGASPPVGEAERRSESDEPLQADGGSEDVGMGPECSETPEKGKMKGVRKITSNTKLIPSMMTSELKQALRDSSDWHPRLSTEVGQLTDMKNTRIVRSRIYVTSASTMHSLFNILRQGHSASGETPIVSNLGKVLDLNYLTHLVFRCYEREPADRGKKASEQVPDDPTLSPGERRKNMEKARYRVEIAMSPGVQVFRGNRHAQWPKGSELRESNCMVAPLEIIGDSIDLTRLERFLAGAVKVYGDHEDETEDEERPSFD